MVKLVKRSTSAAKPKASDRARVAAKRVVRTAVRRVVKPKSRVTKIARKPVDIRLARAVRNPSEKPLKAASMPRVGDVAPDFSLPDANGTLISLANYRGRKVVLYFYPRDDTPGCTIEAHGFRDDHDIFIAKNTVIIGVSKDTCDSHRAFIQKHGLNFILLSDVTGEVVEKYGCWVEKSMYGKKFMGIQRATFVIAENGKVLKVFPKVSPDGHSTEILKML